MAILDDLAIALALQDAAPTVRCNIFVWGEPGYSPGTSHDLVATTRQMGFTPVELCLSDDPQTPSRRMRSAREPGCESVTVAATAKGLADLPLLLSSGDLLFINGYNLSPVQWHLINTHVGRELSHGKLRARPLLVLAPSDANPPPPLVNGALHLEINVPDSGHDASQEPATSPHLPSLSPRRIIQTLNSRQFLSEWNRRHRQAWAYIATDPAATLTSGPAFTPLARRAVPRAQNWALASACWAACGLLGRDPQLLMAGAVGPMGALRALRFAASPDRSTRAPWDIPELNGAPRPGSIASLLRRHQERPRRDSRHEHLGRPPARLRPGVRLDEGHAL